MQYILTSGWEDGVADLTERIVHSLVDGKQVLWLPSGGSNIPVSVEVMGSISTKLSAGLTVLLADERYGEPGHTDSNWTQLMQAGFAAKESTTLPLLTIGQSFEQTIERYSQLAEKAFAKADIVIAQLGIGQDGHIAGILPKSPASYEETALVTGYQAALYQRLTLTFPAFRRVTSAYVFAFGVSKKQTLERLKTTDVSLTEQPAQVLKQLPEAYIYNNQLGE